jgi:protein-arginine kinase activator protein McsA
LEQLQRELDKAIREEDYERAARIRDEIRRLTSSES